MILQKIDHKNIITILLSVSLNIQTYFVIRISKSLKPERVGTLNKYPYLLVIQLKRLKYKFIQIKIKDTKLFVTSLLCQTFTMENVQFKNNLAVQFQVFVTRHQRVSQAFQETTGQLLRRYVVCICRVKSRALSN